MKILRNTLFLFLILTLAGLVFAQDSNDTDTAEATEESVVEATEEVVFDFTATQETIDSTSTQQAIFNTATQSAINATATQSVLQNAATRTQVANATATAIALIPTSTPQYPTFTIGLTVDPPPSVDGTYKAGTTLAFTLLVENEGGGSPLNEPNIVIAIPYNTDIFAEPSSGAISNGGQFSNGTIKWSFNLIEGTSQNLTISAPIRNTIEDDTNVELRAEVRTSNERVTLTRSDISTFTILSSQVAEVITSTSDKAQQGSGLFQSEGSFATLIGGFFGIGILLIFSLGLFSVYKADDDDSRESMFRNTSEILLLLIVLFSVIIMGVQNAIDRESINAIIGGIVGYVAGRVTSKTPKLADILSAVNGPPERGSTTTTITTKTETGSDDDNNDENSDKETP